MNNQASPSIQDFMGQIWSDINDQPSFPDSKPVLAHYTSVPTLESIILNNEIWFSNPLFMNDMQEMRFGMNEGAFAFRNSKLLQDACGDQTKYQSLVKYFDGFFHDFDTNHAFDTYVFCLSEHDRKDTDGKLSMWRGYGSSGGGVAIVFDISKLDPVDESPLIIQKVFYASEKVRREWIDGKISLIADCIRNHGASNDVLHGMAFIFIERLKLFSLFSKHHGFSEENEWRVVYMSERDNEGKLSEMISYSISARGVEPKLKFKFEPIPNVTKDDFSLEKIVDQIILGPTISDGLSANAIKRMLKSNNRKDLSSRVTASTIPYRR